MTPGRITLMGVLNVTPNSFSDGGKFYGGKFDGHEAAIERALEIEREGADILDIGGESTHPNAAPVSGEQEQARVLPVFAALAGRIGIPLSIDSYRAATASAAVAAGASIVNDIWGLQHDTEMARVVARNGAGLCIMHNRKAIDPGCDILADIAAFFARSLEIAAQAGIARDRIVLDPGIGFGKTFEQNIAALHGLRALEKFDLPLLVGASRKGFIGALTGRGVAADRLAGSLGAHAAAVMNGARIIRAHDIPEHRDALAVAAAIRRGSMEQT